MTVVGCAIMWAVLLSQKTNRSPDRVTLADRDCCLGWVPCAPLGNNGDEVGREWPACQKYSYFYCGHDQDQDGPHVHVGLDVCYKN